MYLYKQNSVIIKSMALLRIVVLLILCLQFAWSRENNVCKTREDYFNNIKENPNCWFDSDLNATPEQIAKNHGFLLERHFARTEDKYILTIFRVKSLSGEYGKEVIFIQHGLGVDALYFLANGNKSVAFFLFEQGYDVWVGNYRGSEFSRHEFLSRYNPKFWNFSIHEHGIYDSSANFKYVNENTKKQITYLGHSMGGTAFCIYASMRPEETKNYVRHAILLAPALYLKTSKGITSRQNVMIFYNIAKLINSVIPINVAFGSNSLEKQAFERFCFSSLENLYLCSSLFEELLGKTNNATIPPEKFPMGLRICRNVGLTDVFHYSQMIQRRDFIMFDYGSVENIVKYNSSIPPSYNLSKITIGLTWIYGENDNIVTKSDIVNGFNKFRKANWNIYELPYSHETFLFDKNANKTAYPILLKVINKYT